MGKVARAKAFSLPHLIDYQSEEDFLAALPVNFVAMGTVGVVGQKCHDLCSRFVENCLCSVNFFKRLLLIDVFVELETPNHTPLQSTRRIQSKKR